MHIIPESISRIQNAFRSVWRLLGPWRPAAVAGGLFLAGSSLLSGQTFLAEWTARDLGGIGPTGLALDTIGGTTYLYVSDQNHGRVLKFNAATGVLIAAWGTNGGGPGQFNSPYGIAVDPQSHDLYVAERGNHRIQRITSDGAFVLQWGTLGAGAGQFDGPIGVAADSAGNVYVTDHNNNRVQKFLVQGGGAQFVGVWGGPGAGPGQFNSPYGITLDAAGNLWVADGLNHRLQQFDPSGKFLQAVGTFGTGDGQFVTPTWVNFDSSGSYYVAETNSDPQNANATDIANQRIQKFSSSGAFLLKWGTFGQAGGQFRLPFDVVVDTVGNAYVADYYNTRVEKFSLAAAASAPSRVVNVSARLRTVDGDVSRAFIAGFAVGGTGSKQVLVRAVGPGLNGFGVAGALANPRLRIYSGSQLVAENEDWGGDAAVSAAAQRVGAFPLGNGSKDAALLVTLAPGTYTAQVVTNGGTGIGLVEVYDTDGATAGAELANLSTRGYVDTGDGVLVAGFAVSGSAPKRLLIRGIGPGLTQFGVSGALADPTLKIYSGSTVIAQNDDWGTPQLVPGGQTPASAADIAAAATARGAFALPGGSKDAAVVVTLAPGVYSAVVAGSNNTTGAGLVEVYELP